MCTDSPLSQPLTAFLHFYETIICKKIIKEQNNNNSNNAKNKLRLLQLKNANFKQRFMLVLEYAANAAEKKITIL